MGSLDTDSGRGGGAKMISPALLPAAALTATAVERLQVEKGSGTRFLVTPPSPLPLLFLWIRIQWAPWIRIQEGAKNGPEK